MIVTALKLAITNGVTRIEDKAFSGCDNLESVVVPNSVSTIGATVVVFSSGCCKK